MNVIILKNVQMAEHILLLAYDGGNDRIFQRIDHNKNRRYLYKRYDGLIFQEHNLILYQDLV